MDIALLLLLFLVLGASILIASLINKISKRKILNGGLIFILLSVLLLVYSMVNIPNIKANPEAVGHLIAPFLLPWVIAIYFSRKK